MPAPGQECDAEFPGISRDAARAALKRMLASACFIHAERLSRFLAYIVEKTLAGERQLNEYSIGLDVFDKPERFDPRTDPIVRVHARRLRHRLRKYYQTDGANDSVSIELLPRTYLPTVRQRGTGNAGSSQSEEWRMTTALPNAIAVLPFVSLSSNREDAYFANGLTSELIDNLVRIGGLRIVILEGQQALKRPGLYRSASELGAGLVLEGSIRRAPGQIRISVQLIRATDGSVLLSKMYDSDGVLVPAQESVARLICGSLRMHIETGRNQHEPHGPMDREANRQYLLGTSLLNEPGRDALQNSLEHLAEAVALDPRHGPSHSAMAECYILQAFNGDSAPDDLMRKARTEAKSAIECDANLDGPYVWLGVMDALFNRDIEASKVHFVRARELAPRSPRVACWASIGWLTPTGQFERALAGLQEARDGGALSLSLSNETAYVLHLAGRTDKALEQLRRSLDMGPACALTHWTMGLVRQAQCDWSRAIQSFEEACELSDQAPYALGSLGHALAASGERGAALQVMERLQHYRNRRYVSATDFAVLFAGFGQVDDALTAMREASEQRCPRFLRAALDPRMRALRSDERFIALVRDTLRLERSELRSQSLVALLARVS